MRRWFLSIPLLLASCTISTSTQPPTGYDLICVRNDTTHPVALYYWTDQWKRTTLKPRSYSTISWNHSSRTPKGKAVQVRLDQDLSIGSAWRGYVLYTVYNQKRSCGQENTRYVLGNLPGNGVGLFTRR